MDGQYQNATSGNFNTSFCSGDSEKIGSTEVNGRDQLFETKDRRDVQETTEYIGEQENAQRHRIEVEGVKQEDESQTYGNCYTPIESLDATQGIGECQNAAPTKDLLEIKGQMGKLMLDLGNDGTMLLSHWADILSESEKFEFHCPAQLDKILEEATALEQNLLEQKEQLKGRLQDLSRTLQFS